MANFLCFVSGIFATIGLYLIVDSWRRFKADAPELPPLDVGGKLKETLPEITFWAPLGTIFGLIGIIVLIQMGALPREGATGWLIFGGVAGTIWGGLWGLIFGLTKQQF